MQITVNGKMREVAGTPTLLEYLQSFGLNPTLVAVEYNAEIIRKEQFAERILQPGDQLEIIHMVGGG